ncbi:Heterokaryon incompatibility [Metarhizium rileyi]|uniref:Heterokaryon incompatibility n=1 Tax=Metarhizium rileyi (strain RCEF 4871) TaxID=1649241 RepID=A0A162JFN1_METRR|nr:Heterokaryon incompatibility [Metarhizium rileyi RCEF 4871]
MSESGQSSLSLEQFAPPHDPAEIAFHNFTSITSALTPPAMPYCDRCSTLNAHELRENDLPFHPDLRSMKDSAENGCDFCFVCWSAFSQKASRYVDLLLRGESPFPEGSKWTPAIWLNGNQFGHPTSGDTVAVSLGMRGPGSEFWPDVNPEPIEAELEVYEEPGISSKYNIRGRRSTAFQNPELYVTLIREWLDTCRTEHPRCSLSRGSEMPTRLIYVGDRLKNKEPRLMSTAEHGICEPYMALSYCWGPNTTDIPTLSDATYASFTKRIDESTLSKSHRDMLSLARKLDIKYVWIDALCIIQFNKSDWESESKRMAVVYGNAILTIIAGRSSDSKQGFIANSDEKNRIFCPIPREASEKSTIMVGLKRCTDIGPTSTRAWCFQERLLSQRAVVFGVQQLRFHCMEGSVYEDGSRTTERLASKLLRVSTEHHAPKQGQQHRAQEILKEWYALLFPFTQCQLSNPHDIFASLAAIAQKAAAVLQSRYLAGIWECDLARGLMWRPIYHLTPNRKPATRPRPTRLSGASQTIIIIRAPSWSWASVQGAVIQQTFTPPNVALYEDRSKWKIRPILLHPERWTKNSECGMDKLHMPTCELHFKGRVVEARVLDESPRLRYVGVGVDVGVGEQRNLSTRANISRKYGVLLLDSDAVRESLDPALLLHHVTAIGYFDVQEEKVGCTSVYCLQVVPKSGLMLERNPDASYSRLGWFMLQQDNWFAGQMETDIRLG